jgi:alpha-beta hydrolase superfamily lysophospholipase
VWGRHMFLKTSDNVRIAADFYGVTAPEGYLILVHMMPATKISWRAFAEKGIERGFASLAIDLRGHGESDKGPEGYKQFSDKEHGESIYDVEAAATFLTDQAIPPEKIILIGASIGANLALKYIASHQEFKTVILLSPGTNYKGIETEPLVKRLRANQRVMFVGARDDKRALGNNADMNEKLYNLAPKSMDKKLIILESGGHGTDMLTAEERDIPEKILSFSMLH